MKQTNVVKSISRKLNEIVWGYMPSTYNMLSVGEGGYVAQGSRLEMGILIVSRLGLGTVLGVVVGVRYDFG